MTTPVVTERHGVEPDGRRRSPLRALSVRATRLAAVALAAGALAGAAFALAPRSPAAAPSARAAPSQITLRISSRTPDAHARIDDGPPVALPLETLVARDDRLHAVTVEAPGYAAQTSHLQFSEDLHVATSLAPHTDASP